MRRRDFLRRSAVAGIAGAVAAAGGNLPRATQAQQAAAKPSREPARGPLRVHPENPRYFADGSGRAVYLTGSHTWANLIDIGPADPPPVFDFDAMLSWLERYDHNFIRLWTWELTTWDTRANDRWGKPQPHFCAPQPWPRTGPGNALDGKPKFDLSQFNDEYFSRLRKRVAQAGRRGFYVSVMLFEGCGMQFCPNAWQHHPFHPQNNTSGVGRSVDPDSRGLEIYRLARADVTEVQQKYVSKVIDTVGDLDNVLYEISNENHPPSTEWQYHMIRFIHRQEQRRGRQHPVGMTFQYRGGSNQTLFDSPAEWISPNAEGGYRDNPPAADGRKVVLSDTDHLWGIGGNRAWVWKSFTRGLNPLFMDPYDGVVLAEAFDPQWEPVRKSLGYTRRLALRMNLAAAAPHNEFASSGFCLAVPGREYLVYLPEGGEVEVDLSAARSPLAAQWIDPNSGGGKPGDAVEGGRKQRLRSPLKGDAVLYLHQR